MSDRVIGNDVDDGKAVSIVDVEEDGKLTFDFDALSDILNSDAIRDLPVVVVSITGAFRLGKSFLLNMFLRYLDRYDEANAEPWMGDPEEEIGCLFQWEGGKDLVTKGILMWNKPRIINIGGRKVAILLIDTQGNFDLKTKRDGNYKVFALSALMSSMQLYNVSMKLQSDTFDHLRAFLSYAKACNSESAERFQNLLFVIRDWRKSAEEPYGLEGGMRYLENECSKFLQADGGGLSISGSFTKVECYLLPHPGTAVHNCEKSNELKVKDIDKNFVTQVGELASRIFSDTSCIKELVADDEKLEVDGKGLYRYLELLQKRINSDNLPVIRTMSEYMAMSKCEAKKIHAIAQFKDETKLICERLQNGYLVPWDELHNTLENSEEKVLIDFSSNCYGVGSLMHEETKSLLKSDIKTEKDGMIAQNKENEKITKECAIQKNEAFKKFESMSREIVEILERGYFSPPDGMREKLNQATFVARDVFDQAFGSGSQIHMRFKDQLNTKLQTAMEKLESTNRENKDAFHSYQQQCELITKGHEEQTRKVNGVFTSKKKLRDAHQSEIEKIPADNDTEATKNLRSDALSQMERRYTTHEKKRKRENIKDGVCLAGVAVLGTVAGVVAAPEAAIVLGVVAGVSALTPFVRRATTGIQTLIQERATSGEQEATPLLPPDPRA